MNRQIKFRVWDKEDEYWIDPSHLQVNADGYLYIPYGIAPERNTKRFVIQQYTNLKDKNGREIYEGDIVKLSLCATPDYQEKGLITWSDYHNGWSITRLEVPPESIYKTYAFTPLFISYNLVEIIGNIFENPELL